MDLARTYLAPDGGDGLGARLRGSLDVGRPLDGLEKILRLAPAREPRELQEPVRERAAVGARDISAAMDLVHEAARTIRQADDRAREGEARTQAVLQRATEELRTAEVRVQAAEARARQAEARAQDLETRAQEAENWLRQIFATISEELPPAR